MVSVPVPLGQVPGLFLAIRVANVYQGGLDKAVPVALSVASVRVSVRFVHYQSGHTFGTAISLAVQFLAPGPRKTRTFI
jgi:hypothetical protein